jgi:hypothetical protein
MPAISLSFFLFVFLTAGCATSAPSAQNDKPIDASPSKSTSASMLPNQEKCSKQLNEFGFSDRCDCPTGFAYNRIIGKCTQAGRICTMVISTMIHPKTGKCTDARNGCMASDLKSEGWRNLEPSDHCSPSK